MTRSLLLLCCILFAMCPVLAVRPGHLFYTGTVGKYPVQMDLSLDAPLHGQYSYLGFGDALALKGGINAAGAVQLQEYDGTKRSGAFAGRLSDNRRRFTGTWTSANGKRKLTVALTAQAEFRTIVLAQANCRFTGSYPHFYRNAPTMQALNEKLEKQAHVASTEESTAQVTYAVKIAYYQPDLVSLLIDRADMMMATERWIPDTRR